MGKPKKAERRGRDLDYHGVALAPPMPGDSPAAPWNSRLWVIFLGGVLLLGGVYAYTGDAHFGNVVLGLLNDGLFLTGWATSAGMLGAVVMRVLMGAPVRRDDGPVLSLRVVTAIAVGIGLISLLLLGLGLMGLVKLAAAVVVMLFGPLLWGVMIRLEAGGVERVRGSLRGAGAWLSGPAGWGWLWLLAVPSLVIGCCGASIMPGLLWNPLDPHPYDVSAYHLQVPREWYEAGRIVQLRHNVYSHFPFNVEMHFLLAMLLRGGPWKGMYTAQFISLASCVLTVAAVYAAATDWSRRGGPEGARFKGAGTIAGVLTASAPWIPMLGSLAYVEGMLLLYFTLSFAWVLRAVGDAEPRSCIRAMALAGVLGGLACGVKYTAVPTILIFFPVVFGIVVTSCRMLGRQTVGLRPMLLGCVLFVGAGTMAFAPWMARNLAWTGNPVFPMAMRTLGAAHFDDVQVERWNRAHRPTERDSPWPQRFKLLGRTVMAHWMYAYVIFPGGSVALVALALRRGRGPEVAALALLVLLQIGFWLGFTHLMPRFAVFLLPLCAVAAGIWLSGRLAPAGAALAVVAVWLGFIGLPVAETSALAGGLQPTFWERAVVARVGFYRLEDPKTVLNAAELEGLEGPRRVPLALIGDAQAFLHQVPMERLKYRVIFDIRFPAGASALDAWLGQNEVELRKDHVIIVHPSEIRRLSRTYWAVPGLPDRPIPRGYVTPNNDYQPVGDVTWTQASDLPHIWPQGGVTGAK